MAEQIDIKCPQCGKHWQKFHTGRAGNYDVKCPHCGCEHTIQVLPPKIGGNDESINVGFKTEIGVKVLGKAKLEDDRYVIKEPAKINKVTSLICPRCNKPMAIKPKQVGTQSITCSVCATKIFFTAIDPEEQKRQEELRLQQEEQKRQEALRKQQEQQQRMMEAEALKRKQEQQRLQQQQEQQRLQQQQEQQRLQQQQEEQRRQEMLRQQEPEPDIHYADPEPDNDSPIPEPDQGYYNGETIYDNKPKDQKEPPKRESSTPDPQKPRPMTTAELQWGGNWYTSKSKRRLREGSNIIGRQDSGSPSDIQFIDPEMSRRSVRIDAERRNGVMNYTLTVQKALNPVYVNNQQIAEGKSVTLISGAKIVMGSTTLTFKK